MNLNYLNNKSILITGGIRSLGENFVEFLLKKSKNINKIFNYSRDELKQYQLAQKFKSMKYGFSYSSENNSYFLNLKDLKKVVTKYTKL